MSTGELVKTKYRNREFGSVWIKSVDEGLAAQLPPLRLTTMPEEARAAFRSILTYEAPPANGSLVDFLQLAEARGYTAHPCDWIPDYDWKYAGRHPEIYQPWVDWLSENGLTKFHEGNRLTPENFRRFSPGQRSGPIKALIRQGQVNDFVGIKAVAEANPASLRAALVSEIHAWGSFSGCYPWQVPLIEYFLDDKSDKVRDLARAKLEAMGEYTTAEAYARKLAREITVTGDTVRFTVPPAPHSVPYYKDFACITFDSLADALGLSAIELAERVELEGLGNELRQVAVRTSKADVRSIFAKRYLDHGLTGESLPLALFNGLPKPIWDRGLQAMLKSPYVNSVQEYLGLKTGTLGPAISREWSVFKSIDGTVSAELQKRQLPVNKSYDPLRVLGKTVDKETANEVMEEAIRAGMKPDNPRLTMLKFNLTL